MFWNVPKSTPSYGGTAPDEFKALEVEMNLRHEGMHESEPCSSCLAC